MKSRYIKTQTGLVPFDPDTQERYNKRKIGAVIEVDEKGVRNPLFHRKYFALINFAYEYWEPKTTHEKYGEIEKNFDRYRNDLTILAGYWKRVTRLNGDVRVEPQSISFAKMEQEEFEKLYSKTIDVILKYIFIGMEEDELNDLVNKTLEFI